MSAHAARLALFVVAGVLLGTAQFGSLARTVRLYLRAGPRVSAVALHAVRMLTLAAAWVAMAHFGRAPGLLAAFAGFLISRPFVAAWSNRARA